MARASSGAEDFGLGQAHQIGAVDDLVAQVGQRAAAGRRFRLGGDEGRQFVDHGARRLRIVAGDGVERALPQLFDRGEAGERQQFAGQDDQQRERGDRGHAGRQPAQPVGAREQIADQLVGPQADRQRNQHAECAEEQRAESASAVAARSPAAVRLAIDVRLVEDVDLGRRDDGDVGFHGARLAGRGGVGCAHGRLLLVGAASGSMRKAAGLRGAVMPAGLRSGTAARGRA